MAGRPPKPTALKIVGGNAGKRALNKQEPDPAYLQDLTPPAWLPESAKVVWNELAPALARAKVLSELDVELLAQGCAAMAHFRRAAARAEEQPVKGGGFEEVNGKDVYKPESINPWLIVQSMAFKQAMAVFKEFGMSPAARTRIAIQPQGDLFNGQDKAAEYF